MEKETKSKSEGEKKSETKKMTTSVAQSKLTMPVALIIGAVIIAIGVGVGLSYSGGGDFATQLERYQQEQQEAQLEAQRQQEEELVKLVENVAPVTEEDHVRGNPDAPVVIVEYSDFECPFCKRFHNTMNQLMDEYGDSGELAWVYRHFPLETLHPVKAHLEAVATECAAEQGGNEAFWSYADRFMELTPSNNQTNTDVVLPQIAQELGLNVEAFNTCLGSGRYDEKIASQIENAAQTGGRGTPWSILITKDGEKFPLNGAQPIEVIRQIIDEVTS